MRRSDLGYMPNQWVLSRRHGRSEPTDRPSRRPKLGARQLAAFEVQHRALSHVNLSFIACVPAHNGLIKPAEWRSAVHPLLVLVRAHGMLSGDESEHLLTARGPPVMGREIWLALIFRSREACTYAHPLHFTSD